MLAEGETYRLILGDCLDVMRGMPDASFDAVVTDPPYPCIDRDYGYWTEEEWWALMRPVVSEVRRVLKPTGSAVFILQPNSERVGRMRPWLWDFMSWVCREWNMVQDVWWWNTCALPEAHACQGRLMRPSLKACVWGGPPDCWRDQDAVLGQISERHASRMRQFAGQESSGRRTRPSGQSVDDAKSGRRAAERGGTTPFNVLPVGSSFTNGADLGHGASTPLPLCEWWCRYVVPPEGIVLDPFSGTATVGKAALRQGKRYVGVEKEARYHDAAGKRLAEAEEAVATPLFAHLPQQGRLFGD